MYKKLNVCTTIAALTLMPTITFGDLSLTGGTLNVSSSWSGAPDSGWNGASNSDSNTHGPTFQAIAISSLPLSVANINIADINQTGTRLATDMNMNWTGTVVGLRNFTFDASLDENFSLSSAAHWNRTLLDINPLIPFSRLDLIGAGGTIDLLTTSSGTLPAGSYTLEGEASGAWTFDGLSFLHRNTLVIDFDNSAVPEPSAAFVLCICGLIATGRGKRYVPLP